MTKTICRITIGLALLAWGTGPGTAAESPVTIRWRFVPDKQYAYSYEFSQRTSARSKLDPNPVTPADEDTASGDGRVTVTGERDQGTMRLHHQVRAATRLGRVARPAELVAGSVSASVAIRADGSVATNEAPASANLESFVETMFPVPREPFSATTPARQPMHLIAPGIGDLEGEAVFTYQGEVQTNGLACVRYQVDCQLQTPPPASPAEDRGRGEFAAQVNCLFAPAAGHFFATDSRAVLRYETRSGVEMRLDVTRRVRYQGTEAGQ